MAVFKHKAADTKKYPDGQGDYCHVGVVTGVKPLRITHSSSEAGEVVDVSKIGTFCAWARLKDIDYGTKTEDTKEEVVPMLYQCKVKGGSLNLRKAPEGARITSLKNGSIVCVYEETDEWSRVMQGALAGWVMTKYLERIDTDADQEAQPDHDDQNAGGNDETTEMILTRLSALEASYASVIEILNRLQGD